MAATFFSNEHTNIFFSTFTVTRSVFIFKRYTFNKVNILHQIEFVLRHKKYENSAFMF